ncbi:hypothetical protein TTHERM_00660170 (macronuclear) [Tetrahymena thermophila SB210]|uniref:Uncharacterized protein n=1 Tax=Tetrahymena thermophila (strain SB210) TaxID=312017 RepID=I7LVU4_TETTS|nr:hypothetical protein TTHERM_00660170 [Tetrahymena thermophila SB210]EAR99835.2 hypothetical protein TTHERM_00660170 [Tetrahymena thermophila SB210]|eukprot:XP_001020080.2 hypothetical protein TTHERM_00660170 [Tetrahymena thermophila SB210]
MDSLIQRWKSTVGSGQKSGSFSSRNGNTIEDSAFRHNNSSQNDIYQRDRSLSAKNNEKRDLNDSSSSSSSEIPFSSKRHNQSAMNYQNRTHEDKLDDIFSNSGTKVQQVEGNSKQRQQQGQSTIKPPLKQHQSPQRNGSQDEKSKLKSLRESYANTKANAQINIPQKMQNQSQVFNNNNSLIQNINSNTSRSQIIANSPQRSVAAANNTNRRNMTFYIDESVFRIVDVFTISKQLDHKEQVSRVRNLVETLVENCKNYYGLTANRSNSREDQQSQSQIKETERTLSKIKQTSLAQKAEQNSKIVQDLENKLFECERSRIQLKTENEQQQFKIASLQKEIETIKISNTMLEMVRESQLLLEKNNKTLHEQLKKEELKNIEQQRIFETQLQEVQLIINHLKQQLTQAYSISPTKSLQ